MTKNKKMYVKLGLDLLMGVTFVLFFNKFVLGGLPFHEIAGLVIAAVFFIHVLFNWTWVKKVTVRLFDRKLSVKTKIGYLLNFLLLISMTFIIISGIFISKVVFPNIDVANELWFKIAHMSISYFVLLLVAVHIGLHWKWVMNVFKTMFQFKTKKQSIHLLAKFAVAALLLFGGYEMYATNFSTHLKGVVAVFQPSSIQMIASDGFGGEKGHVEGHRMQEDSIDESFQKERAALSDGNSKIDGSNEGPSFKGQEGTFVSPNVFNVIATYFSIMSVFIILVYYVDKFLTKRTRHKIV